MNLEAAKVRKPCSELNLDRATTARAATATATEGPDRDQIGGAGDLSASRSSFSK
jgi:hypothetical protein